MSPPSVGDRLIVTAEEVGLKAGHTKAEGQVRAPFPAGHAARARSPTMRASAGRPAKLMPALNKARRGAEQVVFAGGLGRLHRLLSVAQRTLCVVEDVGGAGSSHQSLDALAAGELGKEGFELGGRCGIVDAFQPHDSPSQADRSAADHVGLGDEGEGLPEKGHRLTLGPGPPCSVGPGQEVAHGLLGLPGLPPVVGQQGCSLTQGIAGGVLQKAGDRGMAFSAGGLRRAFRKPPPGSACA